MNWNLSLGIVLALGCSPTPGVKVSNDGPVLTPERVDSALKRGKSERADAARRNAADQASTTALAIDSLITEPDSLLLTAGDTIPLFGGPIRWLARDREGRALPHYTPWFRIDNSRVARILGDQLVALAPGRGALLLTVAVRSDSAPPRILHVTRLPLHVR